MSDTQRAVTIIRRPPGHLAMAGDRRSFLKWAGATVAVLTVAGSVTGCSDDETTAPTDNGVNLGSGDVGVLNYADALEQLEAAFYTQVVANLYTGVSTEERTILTLKPTVSLSPQ